MDEKKRQEGSSKIVGKGKTTCACGPGCACGCGCRHHVLWWIVGIIVLFLIFFAGVKAGQFMQHIQDMVYENYPNMVRDGRGYYGTMMPPATTMPTSLPTTTAPTSAPTGQ
jgi:hypothetical protein